MRYVVPMEILWVQNHREFGEKMRFLLPLWDGSFFSLQEPFSLKNDMVKIGVENLSIHERFKTSSNNGYESMDEFVIKEDSQYSCNQHNIT